VSNAFPRAHRLLTSNDFQRVFQAPIKSSDAFFTVLARSTSQNQPARLGLAIARKQLKRAVDRNRVKRLVRECFRLQAPAALDYVVMTRHIVQQKTNAQLRASLARHFERIAAKQS
jgi:ribonuclease P protein component